MTKLQLQVLLKSQNTKLYIFQVFSRCTYTQHIIGNVLELSPFLSLSVLYLHLLPAKIWKIRKYSNNINQQNSNKMAGSLTWILWHFHKAVWNHFVDGQWYLAIFIALYGSHSQSKNGLYFPNFMYFSLFDLILYIPSTIFQLYRDGSSWVEPVLS